MISLHHMRTLLSRRRLASRLCSVVALSALPSLNAWPQPAPGPNKPIRMIVAVGAGGATDTITRRLAERLQKSLGQPVVVENRAGASGVIAAQTVARAAPDGYTLLIGTNTTHAGNASFVKNLPYDPL